MRINILLILFALFIIFPVYISANAVSGQYSLPVSSVRFEKQGNFSLLPVGWSKEGNAAFVIINRSKKNVKLLIINTIEDNILWVSPVFGMDDTRNLNQIWNDNIDIFSNKLADFGIIPDGNPRYGGTAFSEENDNFRLHAKELRQTGVDGITSLSLNIFSEKRGEKTLYKYIYTKERDAILIDFQVLGYFRSPWESRIIAVSAENILKPTGEDFVELRFSGAHLSHGYTRIVNKDTHLIDAVLGGQFYNSRTLLQKGANANSTVQTGEPLVLLAARQFNWDLVFLLIEYGADTRESDKRGRSLLHYAVIDDNEEVVRKLQQIGINETLRDIDGETPLSLAEKMNHMEIISLLK